MKSEGIMSSDILLESGTNEVEILEFELNGDTFGVNVAKIKQLLPFDSNLISHAPGYVDSMMGILSWREYKIPIFDLNVLLKKEPVNTDTRSIVIVTEFNGHLNAFLISTVYKIHRLSWEAIRPVSQVLQQYSPRVTGSVALGENEALLIDFESLVAEVSEEGSDLRYEEKQMKIDPAQGREKVKIVLAEDSQITREVITKILASAGYKDITGCSNGKEALDIIRNLKNFLEVEGGQMCGCVNIVITDLEMPVMDGLSLCKSLKEEFKEEKLPVVIFSSLINEQQELKCQQVGADAYLSKPEVDKLVELVDVLCL